MQEAFATTFDHYGRLEDPTKAVRRSVLRGCASRKPDPDDPTRVTERILGRVRALGRGPRDAVALRYSLGLDAPEIDRTLGLEEGTAAMRLHEAGTELRAGLEVGDDLDQTLETAFAETTAGLGHLLARPGDAERRVYRRRRIRVAIAAVAAVVALIVLFVVLRPSSSEDLSTGGTDTGVTSPSSATTTVPSDSTTTTAAPTTTEAPTTTRGRRGRHLHRGLGRWLVRHRQEGRRARRQPPAGQRGHAVDTAPRRRGPQGPAEGTADDLTVPDLPHPNRPQVADRRAHDLAAIRTDDGHGIPRDPAGRARRRPCRPASTTTPAALVATRDTAPLAEGGTMVENDVVVMTRV